MCDAIQLGLCSSHVIGNLTLDSVKQCAVTRSPTTNIYRLLLDQPLTVRESDATLQPFSTGGTSIDGVLYSAPIVSPIPLLAPNSRYRMDLVFRCEYSESGLAVSSTSLLGLVAGSATGAIRYITTATPPVTLSRSIADIQTVLSFTPLLSSYEFSQTAFVETAASESYSALQLVAFETAALSVNRGIWLAELAITQIG
jgi:hypothetical protein